MLSILTPPHAAHFLLLAARNVGTLRSLGDVPGHEFHGNQYVDGQVSTTKVLEWSSYEDNPQRKDIADLIADIRKHGVKEPLTVYVGDVKDGGAPQLQDGHHRLRAALELGLKTVPVRFAKTFEALVAANRNHTPVHAAADKHVPKISVAVRYAFAMGRKALGQDANVGAAVKAVRKALGDVLPGTLTKALAAGGDAGVAMLARLTGAGDVEGHPFHGNQYTVGYHGTTEDRAAGIKEKGILPDSNNLAFVVSDRATAEEYAKRQARVRSRKEQKEFKPVVVEVHVPTGHAYDKLSSQAEGSPTHKIEGGVPKEWIKQIRALASLTMKFDVKNVAAAKWAREHAAELIDGIATTTEQAIKDAVARAQEAGDLSGQYDDILAAVGDETRANLIARTEAMTAANEGQRQAWDQAVDEGLLTGDEQAEWIATSDACPECEALDGELRPLDGEYPNDGGDGPPLHPNCRCTEGISAQR